MPDKAAPGDKYAAMAVCMDRNDCADKDNKHHFGIHCTKEACGGSFSDSGMRGCDFCGSSGRALYQDRSGHKMTGY